jgi:hypothetical protein
MDEILTLNQELTQQTYHHSPYYAFRIFDPKPGIKSLFAGLISQNMFEFSFGWGNR